MLFEKDFYLWLCSSSTCSLKRVHDLNQHPLKLAAGRYLAGSFLSEENKIMMELKTAAERKTQQPQSKAGDVHPVPLSWLVPKFREAPSAFW